VFAFVCAAIVASSIAPGQAAAPRPLDYRADVGKVKAYVYPADAGSTIAYLAEPEPSKSPSPSPSPSSSPKPKTADKTKAPGSVLTIAMRFT